MSDPLPPDPYENLPKQIQELLKGSNVKSFFSQPAAPRGAAAGDEEDEVEKKHEATLRRIREFNLKPREIRELFAQYRP